MPWRILVLCIALSGCATVAPGPVCVDGHPMVLPIEVKFVGIEMEIICGDKEPQESAYIRIKTNDLIWTALGAVLGAAATASTAFQEKPEEPVLKPAELAEAPDLRPDEMAVELQRPAVLRPIRGLDSWPMGPLAVACGGLVEPEWCFHEIDRIACQRWECPQP
jgi:hypothetical protein